jgi:class 3 adenylate cyclase
MSDPARAEQALLIVFADITRFTVNATHRTDVELAELLDAYYRFAEAEVTRAKGRLVKFMGDAFLAVWSEADSGHGAASLCELKTAVDDFWSKHGWDSRLVVKAHFGRVVAGDFGSPGRFDVIGNEVNTTARLPARSISLSAEAFRRLDEAQRKAFKKHSQPVVYIPQDDPRP